MVHVPYRGGAPALLDLRAGRIQGMFNAVQEALPAVREGATRALAISSKERDRGLLPTCRRWPIRWPTSTACSGRGCSVRPACRRRSWRAPARRCARPTTDPALIARMAEQGVALTTGDDAVLRRTLAEETADVGPPHSRAEHPAGIARGPSRGRDPC